MAKAYDPRVEQVGYDTVVTGNVRVRIVNTRGMDKQYAESFCGAYLQPVAREGESVSTAFDIRYTRNFSELDAKALARSRRTESVGWLARRACDLGLLPV